jgi:hypothetical protein
MIDFTTIAFTDEESKEISELEATSPDKAHFLKTHIALERLGFIVDWKNYDTTTQDSLRETDCFLVNKAGEKLTDLLAGWESEEEDNGTTNARMTFIRHWLPAFPNVTISYRKQTEKPTNSFTIRIKE